jgi:hypothetical protein
MGKYRGSRGTGLYDAILAGRVVEQPSAGGTLSKNVISLVQNSTADEAVVYTLPVPLKGTVVEVGCIGFTTSTGNAVQVKTSTGASIGPNSTTDVLAFGGAPQSARLIALSATKWHLIGQSSGITLQATT